MQNPLLEVKFKMPFDSVKPEHIEPAIKALIAESKARIDAICNIQGPRTFENTMLALDNSTEGLSYARSVIDNLKSVASYPELRTAYNAVQAPISEFYSSITLDERLWNAIKAYAATDDAKALTGPRLRFLEKTMADFKREGADLDPAGKLKLAALDVRLKELTNKFSDNLLDSTAAFELVVTDPSKLAGLPQSAIDAAKADAEAKGVQGWRFSLQAPSYIAVMTYLDDSGIREQVYRAYNTRATEAELDNTPLIKEIIELRKERSAMLGFQTFADLVLEDRMAKSGDAAKAFIEDLQQKVEKRFQEENAELLAFRRTLEGPNAPALQPWDVSYYAEKQRQKEYAFDEEALRPYLPADKAVDGMFEVVRRLYGIEVKEVHDMPTWHESVKTYSIHEKDGTFIGCFYSDLFPRESKRQGAWMDGLITGRPVPGGFEPHLGLICGNFTPPVGDKPALLTHREVETLFHEFGHLLHHALSKVEIKSLAGTNVAWDFVELPSQIMENWCWERECLDIFAAHYETGEKIPDDLFQKMKDAKNFRSANMTMRQLGFALTDLKLHTEYDPAKDGSPVEYARDIMQRYSPAPLPGYYAMLNGFNHLFADPVGYAAGYYSYKWAEALDADGFTRFGKEGIFNPSTGKDFKDIILANGNSEDPMELYKRFMGREPDPNALLIRAGLN